MCSQLEYFSKMDHARNDPFNLAIISHGSDVQPSSSGCNSAESFMEKGMFLTSDCILVHYNVVLDYFIPLNCPILRKKPKFIIFDYYRGRRGLLASSNPSNYPISIHGHSSKVPKHPDFILSSPTAYGDHSYSYPESGSILLQKHFVILSQKIFLEGITM